MIIAGPCSIETKEQFERTLRELLSLNINHIRGGVWKPRTQGGQFEGLGEDAISIIKELKSEFDFTFYTEVSNIEQLNLIKDLDCGIWVGARSVCDPFTIKKLSNAIKPNDFKFIGLKNPIGNDIKLWQGAYNRFMDRGIKTTPIFRGFNIPSIYRNKPDWNLLLKFIDLVKLDKSDIFIDPSHIAGSKDLLKQVIDYAIYIGYKNFMIESHIEPKKALTDNEQQVTPKECMELFNNNELPFSKNLVLKYLRDEIDEIDNDLIKLLNHRKEVSTKIGIIKKELSVSIHDEERRIYVENKWGEFSEIYSIIHELSKSYQI